MSFITGVDTALSDPLESTLKVVPQRLLQGVTQVISDLGVRVPKKLASRLSSVIEEELRLLQGGWTESRENHLSVFLDALQGIETPVLARLAETLVRFTLMRNTMSERQTVGGPIDVAVITRADGFQWVRRKDSFHEF